MFTGQGPCCADCAALGDADGTSCPTSRTGLSRWRLAALVAGAAVAGVAGAAWWFSTKAKLRRRYFESRFEYPTRELPSVESMEEVVFQRRR